MTTLVLVSIGLAAAFALASRRSRARAFRAKWDAHWTEHDRATRSALEMLQALHDAAEMVSCGFFTPVQGVDFINRFARGER